MVVCIIIKLPGVDCKAVMMVFLESFPTVQAMNRKVAVAPIKFSPPIVTSEEVVPVNIGSERSDTTHGTVMS